MESINEGILPLTPIEVDHCALLQQFKRNSVEKKRVFLAHHLDASPADPESGTLCQMRNLYLCKF